MDDWYYARGGQAVGPMSRLLLIDTLKQDASWQTVKVWGPGLVSWTEAGAVRALTYDMEPPQRGVRGSRDALLYMGLAAIGIVAGVIVWWLVLRR